MSAPDAGIEALADRVIAAAPARPGWARMVAISGIDGSGKSTLAAAAKRALERRGVRTAGIALDDWHHPAAVRFSAHQPGEHFYRHGFDFATLFAEVIGPLRARRALALDIERPHPFTGRPVRLRYQHADVDVVLLEGVFLLRPVWRERYDLRAWIECPFETALERALARNQEGRPAAGLADDYRRIYFAAQRIHLELDRPHRIADLVIDHRELAGPSAHSNR